mgnify:CR=1 FL=1
MVTILVKILRNSLVMRNLTNHGLALNLLLYIRPIIAIWNGLFSHRERFKIKLIKLSSNRIWNYFFFINISTFTVRGQCQPQIGRSILAMNFVDPNPSWSWWPQFLRGKFKNWIKLIRRLFWIFSSMLQVCGKIITWSHQV